MKMIADMPATVAANVEVVFADIDDTLTCDGVLPARSYAALEALSLAGIAVVPVTGRPAGWCDLIARIWPVAGVVGENGAFYFAYDRAARQMRREFATGPDERAANRKRLSTLASRILAEVPGCAIAADQLYREADLAIDFREDVPPLTRGDVAHIHRIFTEEGANAKVSSIHVNGWFGTYDKLTMCRHFACEVLNLDIDQANERIVFVGDSPNDAPMFEFFRNSCGVANVRHFIGQLEAEPAFVAAHEGGNGFVEIAHHLLAARGRAGELQ